MKTTAIKDILERNRHRFAAVVPVKLAEKQLSYLDLSAGNKQLSPDLVADNESFDAYIRDLVERDSSDLAIGKYDEDRTIYRKSEHFTPEEGEPRSIHLGADIWLEEKTAVKAPFPGNIHSFQNNDNFGDYGPTIILEHRLEGYPFYTLYGHLSSDSLRNIHEGQFVEKGCIFAYLGNPTENGHWPAHLHFQIISDMLGKKGDFPGVAKPSERKKYLEICPDPGIILGINVR